MDTHTVGKTPWIHYETLIIFTSPETLFWPNEEERRPLADLISYTPPTFLQGSPPQQQQNEG